MISTGIEPTDLELMFRSETWLWFKAFCAEQAQTQRELILGSDPNVNAWAISKAQGYYEAMSSIAEGLPTPNGKVSWEQYLLDKLHDQIQANGETHEQLV